MEVSSATCFHQWLAVQDPETISGSQLLLERRLGFLCQQLRCECFVSCCICMFTCCKSYTLVTDSFLSSPCALPVSLGISHACFFPTRFQLDCLMWWSCDALQAHKCHERSSDLSECHVSLPACAQRAQQDRLGSIGSEGNATGADKAPVAPGRALAHSPSGKGSSSLDQIVLEQRSSPADSSGNITLSAGKHTHSAGAVHSEGPVMQSVGGATNDSSHACSCGHLAQDGNASAMAQLAEAAAVMCSEEKALQAQQAGQQHKDTSSPCDSKAAIPDKPLVHGS